MQDMERHLLAVLEHMSMELNSPINKERQRNKFAEFAEIVKAIEARSSAASATCTNTTTTTAAAAAATSRLSTTTTSVSEKRYLANKSNAPGSLDATTALTAASGSGGGETRLGALGGLDDVQLTLREEQKAFKSLIEIINQDLRTLNVIQQNFARDK